MIIIDVKLVIKVILLQGCKQYPIPVNYIDGVRNNTIFRVLITEKKFKYL